MAVVFNDNPNTTVVVNYSPVEGSEESEDHYETLTNTIIDIETSCNSTLMPTWKKRKLFDMHFMKELTCN